MMMFWIVNQNDKQESNSYIRGNKTNVTPIRIQQNTPPIPKGIGISIVQNNPKKVK